MDTIFTFLDALGREAIATARFAGDTAWTWLVAQPLWLSLTLAVATKAALVVLFVMVRRRQARTRRVSIARGRAAAVRSGRGTALNLRSPKPRGVPRTPAAGATQARELVLHGVPAIEISRRTGLSRDAVSLLLAQQGREARQGRPTPAGVSSRAGGTAIPRYAGARA